MGRFFRRAAASIAVAALLALPAAPVGAAQPQLNFQAGISIPGTHLAFDDSPTDLNREMGLVAATRSAWIRFDIPEVQVESAPGVRDWSNIDRIVAAAQSHGLLILATLSTLPGWASSSWQDGPTNAAQIAAYSSFAAAAAARYAGRIDAWEIWNEPNNPEFWASPSPAQYEALLAVAYPAIKAGNPAAQVVLGAPAGGQPAPLDTADWYRQLYNLGGRPFFDVANLHPYPASAAAGADSGEQAVVGQVLEVMAANGDAGKYVVGTETGFPTTGSNSTGEVQQAVLRLTARSTPARACPQPCASSPAVR